ncbi:DUF354 domain-containing protein [Haloarchaeobius sp. DYHT-AS-18]|uniref:DUF354 domain-containing protein n=1 Tax=Haloarchaeobius sp. DYHT-AS-18 TaxID=3446117 RepID=UPI003EBCE79E
MRVIVTIQHPGHVHFFKHAIQELEAQGHEVHVFARRMGVNLELLDAYGIDYEVLADESEGLASLAFVQATYEAKLLARAWKIDPDVITAIGGVAASHVAKLVGARSVIFYDTEHAKLITSLAYPFADQLCLPDCYDGDPGGTQRRYPGYHELAYLHPDRFEPDPSVLDEVGLDPDDTFVVGRFNGWGASHDLGEGGFDNVTEVFDRLEATGATVLFTSEKPLPAHLEDRRMTVAPERMHDLLYYADLFVGEGATTAAESAVLGTPAVYVNTLTMGYTQELEQEYGLLYNFDTKNRHSEALRKAEYILEEYQPARWQRRRQNLLADKVDATDVIVNQVTSREPAPVTA